MASATPETQGNTGLPANDSGSEEFYYFGNTRVYLERSSNEILVEVENNSAVSVADLSKTLAADFQLTEAQIGPETQALGRSFRVVRLSDSAKPEISSASAASAAMARLRLSRNVASAAPVFRERSSGARLLPTDEVIVKVLPNGASSVEALAAAMDLSVNRQLRGASDEFVLRVKDGADPLAKARALSESGLVLWAEPNFLQDYARTAVPNDPRFNQQWHLVNTGQGGGVVGADIRAADAWDIERGNPETVIAILDDGVDLEHEDLASNIYVNVREVPNNGYDDDDNGYIDDVRGWDFAQDDKNPEPDASDDVHGTPVAGIAAARGNNGLGISGACPECRILPVRIVHASVFTSADRIAEAIRYAANIADVINNSWGGGAPSSAIGAAIDYAATAGRSGRGAVVVSAAGNRSGGNAQLSSSRLPAGTHRFRWSYSKDDTVVGGDDAGWLAAVSFPGGEVVRFEGASLPSGWVTGGDAPWEHVVDPLHADEGSCAVTAVRSGTIGDLQTSYIEVVKTVPAGDFLSLQFVSSEGGFDGIRVQIDLGNNGQVDLQSSLLSGVPPSGVSYPAAYQQSLAVGASSNADCRSHYSQTGPALSFVAPGSGGFSNLGIHTTDRSFSSGYDFGSYFDDFGGTSSASPLAAGVVGLMLSRNPQLTQSAIRNILQSTADKIGPSAYVNGRNDRYGAGRINAWRALGAVAPPSQAEPPLITTQPNGQMVPSGEQVRLSVVATGFAVTYQWYRGISGDVSMPVGGAIAAVFDTPPITAPASYWVRVSNGVGAVDSTTAVLTVAAGWDATLHVPRCISLTEVCDSGWLLTGRGFYDGPEPHSPNTIGGSCQDSTGREAINRIDRIRISRVSGPEFVSGELVQVEVDVVTSRAPGRVFLYASGDVTSPIPNWLFMAVLEAPFAGPHTFVHTYRLPSGAVQALQVSLVDEPVEANPFGCVRNAVSDNDVLVFPARDVAASPMIVTHPKDSVRSDTFGIDLVVTATGSGPLTYQWYRVGASGASSPIAGATNRVYGFWSNSPASERYWVRVSNAFGYVDSNVATTTYVTTTVATYDTTLRVPRCALAYFCVSFSGGRPEQNQPNTIFSSCQDGTAGRVSDESVERFSIGTFDRRPMAAGSLVSLAVSINAPSFYYDVVEFYHAADAMNPSWTLVATLRPNNVVVSTQFVLPHGPLQAVRARIRYRGSPGPCGPGGADSYDDHDDLVFAVDSPTSLPPSVVAQPQSQVIAQGGNATLDVFAVGASLSFQWFLGQSGDTSHPIAGATSRSFTTTAVVGKRDYWVRVNATGGTVDSATATIVGAISGAAIFDNVLKAPVCGTLVGWCDSMTLLEGRGLVGPERNAPNTLLTTCQDGASGQFHTDESIDRVRVSTVNGDPFSAGSVVRIDVTAWIVSYLSNFVDLYYTANTSTPTWTHIATLTPTSGGLQTLTTAYVLPSGTLHAVRARLRYRGVQAPCGTGVFDDHDDLVFAVDEPYSGSFQVPATFAVTPAPVKVASVQAAPSLLHGGIPMPTVPAAVLSGGGMVSGLGRHTPPMVESSATAFISERTSVLTAEIDREPVAGSTLPVSPVEASTATAVPVAAPPPLVTYGEVYPFVLTFAAVTGAPRIAYTEVRFDAPTVTLRADHSCVLYVERATNTVFLVDDTGRELLSGAAGGAGALRNAQCSIDLATVRLATTDTELKLSLIARFSEDFAARVQVYTQTVDASGVSSGWTRQAESTETPSSP